MTLRTHNAVPTPTLHEGRRRRFPASSSPAPRGHVMLLFQPVVGGVPEYVANLAEELTARHWALTIAAPSDTPVLERLTRLGHEVLVLNAGSGPAPGDLRRIRDLAAACRDRHVDLIHAHSSKAGLIGAAVGKLAGLPSVYSPHAWSFQRELSAKGQHAYVSAERFLAKRHSRVIAVADAERRAAVENRVMSPERLTLVHTGLRPAVLPAREYARRTLGLRAGDFVVGWVGRVGPQKRSEQLPDIARGLGDEGRVLALGYGLEQTDQGHELSDLGAVVSSDTNPELIYAAADAFVITSRWEGLPLVILEAMRAGLPVVGYDVGGVREQIEEGRTGFLVPSGDSDMIVERLRQLAGDHALRHRMALAAAGRFDDHFGMERMVGAIEQIYEEVLGARRGAPPAPRSFRLSHSRTA